MTVQAGKAREAVRQEVDPRLHRRGARMAVKEGAHWGNQKGDSHKEMERGQYVSTGGGPQNG